ncbi:DUF4178 domain-containing protein [Parasynechococcus sp.]|jgi:hypothetical protein|uniref:DUF4178 domain-containing protein n=1 Tax=Parasynechococcus sp. TaxID=3101203 RepID=UPI003704524A
MTGTLMVLLLLLLAVIAFIGVQRRAARSRQQVETNRELTLFDLRVGDIVQHDATDWVVEDRLVYRQGEFSWLEYLLRDDDRSVWLVVNEDDNLVVTLEHEIELPLSLDAKPPSQLEVDGRVYRLSERGTADVTAEQRRVNRRLGACQFFDYRSGSSAVLSIELWGGRAGEAGELEVTVGERIRPLSLSLLPGDGQSVYRPS